MARDKYSAVWVSHSSMGDFLKCPRAYYLNNVYKHPKTGRKIGLVSPAMSLGSAVHEVVEALADVKAEDRPLHLTKEALMSAYEKAWKHVSGKGGGFLTSFEEEESKKRGREMIMRVSKKPGMLLEKTIRIPNGENGLPPSFLLSEEDNIILCGKIDWLVYKPETDSIHILDFKTGKHEEKEDSLQLPIYQLLLKKLQKRKVTGASYWYFDRDDDPIDVELPDHEESYRKVFEVAKRVKDSRAQALLEKPENVFVCPRGEEGCFACRPLEKIIHNEAEYVGTSAMKKDLYIVS